MHSRQLHTGLLMAALVGLLTACGTRALDEARVTAFIDQADAAARKRFAPEICALRSRDFKLQQTFHAQDAATPTVLTIDKTLYCKMAAVHARLQQYELSRESLEIDLAPNLKSASVVARYIEKKPFYGDMQPMFPDDYVDVEVLESVDTSTVAIEDGELIFTETRAVAHQKLVPRTQLQLPYSK